MNSFQDHLTLYTPTDAPALKELSQLSGLFPINDSDPYYAQRRFRDAHGRWATTRDELVQSKTHPYLRVETTESAFEMRLPAPAGGDMVIREDGRVFRDEGK